MKTLRLITASFLLAISLLLSNCLYGQVESKSVFIRVYNLEGKKISKGKIVSLNDSILRLTLAGVKKSVNFKDIGYIKTKRSGGHNVGMGILIGGTVGAIAGATLFEPDPPGTWIRYTRGDNAGIGAILGSMSGAAIGGVTALTKKSKTFIINGNSQNWNAFQEAFNN
ncbi:hypothetical protein WJN01_14910 [Flavobacteriaceae bacterium SZ-1-7]|uniref:hypothetical protein n=1 Tax=Tamlana sedimenti TaxID=3134126 RepID=UPI003122A39A